MSNAFDAGSTLYLGKWEGVEPWKLRVFWAIVKWHRADRRVPFGAQKNPPSAPTSSNGLRNGYCLHENRYVPRHKKIRYIIS